MLGALLLQYPIGKLSDVFDRRSVIVIVQTLAIVVSALAYFTESMHFYVLLVTAAIYGGIHTPLYSLYIAMPMTF